ncbi:hypothetical protein JW592_00480 [Streptomyces sp. DW4-2]|uniref:Acyl-CoA dehydrogenase C-terminal domain-containing protein n=1 Tax=Streptomyces spirodelae TaxID=2812904 RepID=A0ABS3WLS5_9ACTN|nr:hypothetical protein [Streptomyces spirodelae]
MHGAAISRDRAYMARLCIRAVQRLVQLAGTAAHHDASPVVPASRTQDVPESRPRTPVAGGFARGDHDRDRVRFAAQGLPSGCAPVLLRAKRTWRRR